MILRIQIGKFRTNNGEWLIISGLDDRSFSGNYFLRRIARGPENYFDKVYATEVVYVDVDGENVGLRPWLSRSTGALGLERPGKTELIFRYM